MTTFALGLVLLSAGLHAFWNFLMKGSRDPLVFSWGLVASATVLYAPVAVWRWQSTPLPPDGWIFVAGTVALHLIYFWALARAYAAGDLSVVYPLARGLGPLFVPILAVLLLAESLTALASAGVALVVLGIYVLHLRDLHRTAWIEPVKGLRGRASLFAILTGLTITTYSLWDKQAVMRIDPLLYNYFLFAGSAIVLAPLVLYERRGLVLAELRHRPLPMVAAGILSPITYFLVLTALSMSPVSYVIPIREVGIVGGALLGTVVLGEPYGPQRVLGSAIIAVGVTALALG